MFALTALLTSCWAAFVMATEWTKTPPMSLLTPALVALKKEVEREGRVRWRFGMRFCENMVKD